MKKNKDYTVDIDFAPIEIHVKAKNKAEARKKALAKLARKNPCSLIRLQWPSMKKDIGVEEN